MPWQLFCHSTQETFNNYHHNGQNTNLTYDPANSPGMHHTLLQLSQQVHHVTAMVMLIGECYSHNT